MSFVGNITKNILVSFFPDTVYKRSDMHDMESRRHVTLYYAFAGIILVLTLGVALGVAVGVLMLSVVIAYMRRLDRSVDRHSLPVIASSISKRHVMLCVLFESSVLKSNFS